LDSQTDTGVALAMKTNNFPYAVLGVVANYADGVHGYELRTYMEALSDEFWEINYGKLYRALDYLERAGSVTSYELIQSGRPNRKVFRITDAGGKSLDSWLVEPVAEHPQPLRDELSLKLLFIGARSTDQIATLIVQQRAIYMKRLARISRRRRKLEKVGFDARAISVVIDGAEMRVRADLGWLDHIERQVIRLY
jgi:DNA-binding PadR family transcriptional regulator